MKILEKEDLSLLLKKEDLSIKELELLIINLSYRYYNTKKEFIDDKNYDILVDKLKKLNPESKVFKSIGAPVIKDKILLPYEMGSLNKYKPDMEKKINKWIKDYPGNYIISEKLDGVSAQLYKNNFGELKFYTRGDGKYGQDISYLIKYIFKDNLETIRKNMKNKESIRGEIIINKKDFLTYNKDNKFKNSRNTISGVITSKKVNIKLLKYIKFVSYLVIYPRLCILDQMNFLKKLNVDIVKYKLYKEINIDILIKILNKRKINSEFEIDGIVCTDNSKIYNHIGGFPKFTFAFKILLLDDIKQTKIKSIEWKISKQGYLKPVIIIEPTEISGVTINRITGYNGGFIKKNNLGMGDIIEITRSGDVIPKFISVVKSVDKISPDFPKDIEYEWNNTGIEIKPKNFTKKNKDDIKILSIISFFKILGVKNLSSKTIEKFYHYGLNSLRKILTSDINLISIKGLGTKSINKIYDNIKKCIINIPLSRLMNASQIFIGFGEKKIDLILQNIEIKKFLDFKYDEDDLINKIKNIKGFEEKTSISFVKKIPKFIKFYNYIKNINGLSIDIKNKNNNNNKNIVFSGIRNKDLENKLIEKGYIISNSINKDTLFLIVKSLKDDSKKISKAKDMKIKIVEYKENLINLINL